MSEPFNFTLARINKGLTQRALAEKAGVSLMTVQRAEDGKPVTVSNAKKLADVLEVTPLDVYGLERATREAA